MKSSIKAYRSSIKCDRDRTSKCLDNQAMLAHWPNLVVPTNTSVTKVIRTALNVQLGIFDQPQRFDRWGSPLNELDGPVGFDAWEHPENVKDFDRAIQWPADLLANERLICSSKASVTPFEVPFRHRREELKPPSFPEFILKNVASLFGKT